MRMIQSYLLAFIPYFPEDKTEYIPAAFTTLLFGIACYITFRFIVRYSKKEEQKTKELEEKLNQNNNQKDS